MAYTDQKQNRTVAVGAVALVHLGLGAALLSGLAVKFKPEVITVLEGTNVPVEVPPPSKEPLPPEPKLERTQPTNPPINAPIPVVRTPVIDSIDTTPIIYPPEPAVLPTLPIEPPTLAVEPSPPPANLSRGLQPKGNQGDWFPQDSYPAAARRAGAEGRVNVSVDVGANGRVVACRVVTSSGNDDLDAATCRLATRNGRFTPALNAAGEPAPATVTLRPVRWKLEQ